MQILELSTYGVICSLVFCMGAVMNKSLSLVLREGISNKTTANIANET